PPLLSACEALENWSTTEVNSSIVPDSGLTTAALRAGCRLPVPSDLLPEPRRWLRAIVVAAPRRQGRAIAEPQHLETNRAPPPKAVGAARKDRGAALPRVGPRGPDFSDSDFRFLSVRGHAALAAKPLPPAGGCATRAHRRARCLAPPHWR